MVDHHATVTYVVESCHNAARTSRMTQSLVNPSSSWRVGPAGTLVLRWLRILPFQLQPHRCQNSRYTSGTSSELASWPETKKQTSRHFDFFGVWDHPSPSSPSKIQVIPRLYHFCRACGFQGWWSFFPIGFCFPPAAPWIRLFQEGFPCILPF